MENNEIITNGEIVETVDEAAVEVVPAHNGTKVAIGIGVAALVSAAAYKWVIKPIRKKLKSKKTGTAKVKGEPIEVEVHEEYDSNNEEDTE